MVVEAIKLVEGGLAGLCDEVWLVTCDPGHQRERLLGRGMTEADAEQRIAAQEGLVERLHRGRRGSSTHRARRQRRGRWSRRCSAPTR